MVIWLARQNYCMNQDPETSADGPQDGKDRQEIGCSHSLLIVRAMVDCQFFLFRFFKFFLIYIFVTRLFLFFFIIVLTWFCFLKSVLICMLLHTRCGVITRCYCVLNVKLNIRC